MLVISRDSELGTLCDETTLAVTLSLTLTLTLILTLTLTLTLTRHALRRDPQASPAGKGGGAVAVASALALLGPAGREMMRDLAAAAELPSGKGVDSGWGERRP